MKKGYFGIGVWYPHKDCNVGTLFRSAYAFDADFLFTVGRKYQCQSSDTCRSIRHLPYYNFLDIFEFKKGIPISCQIVCVEITDNAKDLKNFCHPPRAVYLLGNEGGGLPNELLQNSLVVKIDTSVCLNLSTAGSIVMYDRTIKMRN